ncbi:arabinofuranosidase [Amylostereum chailletii]|nr:arabinofuranosidase [Amylostereum chailletii]
MSPLGRLTQTWILCFVIQVVSAALYRNPILPGFHPDPSCTRVDDTYFCATSSFNAFPAIPVFASKDLRNFRQIGNVITRPAQLPGLGITNGSTSGMWAPSIRYHQGTFWIVSTLVFDHLAANDSSRWDNVLFHTTNPFDSDSWSEAVHFTFEGYDASPFWDNQGRSYIVASHAWHVRPAIQGFEMDFSTGVIIGEIRDMWSGTGGIAPEAPHLIFQDEYYYLMIAEGGTGLNHMVTYARSRNLWGPYEPDPSNPVLTNSNTTEYFQTVGHADLFSDPEGNFGQSDSLISSWSRWAVALATRSGPDYIYFPMGRETVLTTAQWERGQFPTFTPVRGQEQGPLPRSNKDVGTFGYWVGSDDHLAFSPGSQLPSHYVHNRFPDASSYHISPNLHPNTLQLKPSVLNLTGPDGRTASTPQTFVGRRQEHVEFNFQVTLDFRSNQAEAEAGVTVFLNQNQHFDLGLVTLSPESALREGYTGALNGNITHFMRLRSITKNSTNDGASDPISRPAIIPVSQELLSHLELRVEAVNRTAYAFRYKNGTDWVTVGWGDSGEISGGFVGTLVGLFATGNGNEVLDMAYFSSLSYEGNDSVF